MTAPDPFLAPTPRSNSRSQAAWPGGLSDIAEHVSARIADGTDKHGSMVMAGAVHRIIPPREGGVFYSLAFRRAPGTTIEQFRDWWLNQHAGIATPLMQPDIFAYDQVHVDPALSAEIAGVTAFHYGEYDAYDNLTWENAEGQRNLIRNGDVARISYEDEVGHVDHATYVGNLMTTLLSKSY